MTEYMRDRDRVAVIFRADPELKREEDERRRRVDALLEAKGVRPRRRW